MISANDLAPLERVQDYWIGTFTAMGSPCCLLADTDDETKAEQLLKIAEREARRIEQKFSRYRTDNIIHRINNANGRPVDVDPETAHLLDYAALCYEMSGGLFDVTSGVLRKLWKFDGGSQAPTPQAARALLSHVGWPRVCWQNPEICMPPDMELDLGGIGKEYAVDRAANLIALEADCSFIVNFGGDLYVSGMRRGNRRWGVGIDDPDRTGEAALYRLDVERAGIATTGNARRYVLWSGKRLSHILNPKTGWPVENPPRAVTVVASTCLEAGTLSTMAYLQGEHAKSFLEEQGVQHWIV